MIKFGNDIIKVNNSWLTTGEPTPPGPVFPYRTVHLVNDNYNVDMEIFAENLHEDDGGEGIFRVDNVTANGVDYGTQYFYTKAAAERVASNFEGWHLPDMDESMDIMYAALGDAIVVDSHQIFLKLASTSGWNNGYNGIDSIGFDATPVGQYTNGSHNNAGFETHYWSSEGSYRTLLSLYQSNGIWMYSGEERNKGYSVRLVKDKE